MGIIFFLPLFHQRIANFGAEPYVRHNFAPLYHSVNKLLEKPSYSSITRNVKILYQSTYSHCKSPFPFPIRTLLQPFPPRQTEPPRACACSARVSAHTTCLDILADQ